MTISTLRRLAAALLAVACVGAVAACGDDSSGGDTAAGCKADFAVNTGFDKLATSNPALQGGKPLAGPQLAQFQKSYDQTVAGPLADLQDNAPDEIADEVDAAVAASKKLRATGNAAPLQSPAFQAQTAKIDKYYFDKCDGQKATVAGVDYGYKGGPATYKPGQTRIAFPNQGKEFHEMALVRKKPDVTESFDALLKEGDAAQSKIDFVTQVSADPGKEDFIATNLTKGDYLMVCFVPKGTASSTGPDGKGPPHFVLGMKKEFTVQ
jgi:uncharacterized cupredoxin-like copper-binding protein